MNNSNWWNKACAVCVLCEATAIATPAQTFTSLFSFDSADGPNPAGSLLQATDGNLYGTTVEGGANAGALDLGGPVFKISPSATLTTIYSFCSQSDCTDGDVIFAGLVPAGDGNLYGTTQEGGAHGDGTIFRITPSGTLTTLYAFCSESGCTDGQYPSAALVQANDGSLYGTTASGGSYSPSGTVFKVTSRGSLTTLDSFNVLDGADPVSALVQATDGDLYGTTAEGGP